jgi:hypothetical protein
MVCLTHVQWPESTAQPHTMKVTRFDSACVHKIPEALPQTVCANARVDIVFLVGYALHSESVAVAGAAGPLTATGLVAGASVDARLDAEPMTPMLLRIAHTTPKER